MTPAEVHRSRIEEYMRSLERDAKAYRTQTAYRYLAALREQVKGRR